MTKEETIRWYQLVIDDTGSVEGTFAFIYCTKWRLEHKLMNKFWPIVYPILQGKNGQNKPENQQN